LLKEIPPEYTEELKYYKRTGYLTSSLFLNATMVFMEELKVGELTSAIVNEEAVKRIILMGASPVDAANWKQAYEDYHAIEGKVKEFSEKCWPDIHRKNSKASFTCLRFTCDDCTLLSMNTAGRILMTISFKMDHNLFLSIVGDGSTYEGKEGKYYLTSNGNYSRVSSCGLQGIHAKKDEAVKYIGSIMLNWDVEKYCVHKNENIGIC